MKHHLVDWKKIVKERNEEFNTWFDKQPKPLFDHAKERRSSKWKEKDHKSNN